MHFISDYHHICYRSLLLRSSLHTPFYKPKSTIHASPQSGIPDTRTHITLDGKIEEVRLNKIFMTTTALVRDIQ